MLTSPITALIVGYLLGSLPFGYLVARARGVNIFEEGSKNPGATNVGRVCGFWWGKLVLLLDALKGAAAAGWPLLHCTWTTNAKGLPSSISVELITGDPNATNMAVAGLIGAVLGHSFSCFTKFRGGKGVATGAGGMLVALPIPALIALGVFLLVRFTTRYVSLASMVAAGSLPISSWLLHERTVLIAMSAAIAVFVVVRHRANISRLLAGTESKAGGPSKS
jgi:acyl phosphate:glycerol-3-phosphate acyltransferase